LRDAIRCRSRLTPRHRPGRPSRLWRPPGPSVSVGRSERRSFAGSPPYGVIPSESRFLGRRGICTCFSPLVAIPSPGLCTGACLLRPGCSFGRVAFAFLDRLSQANIIWKTAFYRILETVFSFLIIELRRFLIPVPYIRTDDPVGIVTLSESPHKRRRVEGFLFSLFFVRPLTKFSSRRTCLQPRLTLAHRIRQFQLADSKQREVRLAHWSGRRGSPRQTEATNERKTSRDCSLAGGQSKRASPAANALLPSRALLNCDYQGRTAGRCYPTASYRERHRIRAGRRARISAATTASSAHTTARASSTTT